MKLEAARTPIFQEKSVPDNEGTLSKHRREGEFRQLRDGEVKLLEGIVRDASGTIWSVGR